MEWIATVWNCSKNLAFEQGPSSQRDPEWSGQCSPSHSLPIGGEDVLGPGVMFSPFREWAAAWMCSSLSFVEARVETMWGLLLFRGMGSSLHILRTSCRPQPLSCTPLTQPGSPEGSSEHFSSRPCGDWQTSMRLLDSESERRGSTHGPGGKIMPEFQTKSHDYFRCCGEFYTVCVRALPFFPFVIPHFVLGEDWH